MSLFSKRRKDGSTSSNRQPSNTKSSLPLLYQDLSLPLNLFIRCIIKSDLSALVISGDPKQEDVAQAWASIYNKYLDLNEDTQVMYALQLQKEITLLSSLVTEVETCLFYLSINMFHEGLVRILKQNGYEYTGDVQIIRNQLAIKRQALESKSKEFKDYLAAHEKDEISETYFTKTLIRLAKYQGVALIRSKDISVEEFVVLMKDYIEYVNQNKKTLDDGSKG